MAKASRSVQSRLPADKQTRTRPRQAATEKTVSGAMADKAALTRVAAEPAPSGWATDLVFDVRESKLAVSLRLDADVLRFFRGFGSGYQTRINEVLKAFMQARGSAEIVGPALAGARANRPSGGNGKRATR